jgi:hypothetical protein
VPEAPAPAAPAQQTPAAPADVGTLKPHHRRRALRDPRMQAITQSKERMLSARRPSRRSFTRDEAARLFAGTLRTRDAGLRTLTTDAEQLVRYGLPVWNNEADVAQALEVSVASLRHFSMHRAQDRAPHYVTFAIAKRRGGERLIMAPKQRLKALQRRLHALLGSRLPISEFAHGFRRGHSIVDNARPHVGKAVVLRLDIRDFFPSIHFARVRGLLLAFGYAYPVASILAALTTEAPRQPVQVGDMLFFPPVGPRACPQGAPTSPAIANALLVRMDRRLAGLARRFDFSYSRYADDLTFSGNDIANAHKIRLLATRIVQDEGFQINPDKTRVMRDGSRQVVTGVVINRVLGLSRQTRRYLRAAVHRCVQAHLAGTADRATLARVEGQLAYLSMLNPEQARKLALKG